ncbi:leucyl aminopeptidase family protein [Algoriphagus pacificus]|uniref:Leucyl aminopeptidase family protein n=1 Tax=Algoriphagus pacificus TaxID=2811234 RepID=A0ABS3CGP2_9BACT|nr:leucyl aminopeptidase family protein [Algoriphagus pacificus]MBN7815955.1 leucyl aminopeptidase family protein [Algoriphagus pacificus]
MNFSIHTKSTDLKALTVFPVLEENAEEAILKRFGTSMKSSLFSGKMDSSYASEIIGNLVLFVGLGTNPKAFEIEKSFRRILSKNSSLIESEITLDFSGISDPTIVLSALTGFQLGAYSIGHFKKEKPKDFAELQVFILSEIDGIEAILSKSQKIASAKAEAFKLVDLPPNILTPDYLVEWSTKQADKLGLRATFFDEKAAEKENLKAFLAVGRGSAKPSQFIILEYRHPKATKHIGLVGKGVTFDTGGLNIKTAGMVHMKSDMGGAAAVLGATQLIADLGLEINLTTIVPAVENAVDKDAYLPSEVIGSHSGLSIEVIDTDAEGRLILADGLSYMVKNFKPDHLIDFATLTGSSVGTFGYECGALFSNDDELSSALQKAGMATGEKVWPLPIWEAYKSEMDSEIADIKNYHGKPFAGAITAAKFLEAFIHDHKSWAHLDIAGVAYGDSEFSKTKTGTAFGVGLLLKFIENLS